jgi:hypothetical protein
MHTLLDLQGSIPVFIEITVGSVHDVNILDHLIIEPGSFIVIDRGYLDFKRLYILSQNMVYFVIRAKKGFKFRRVYSHEVDCVLPQLKLEFWDRNLRHFSLEKNDAQNAQKLHGRTKGLYSSPPFDRQGSRFKSVRGTGTAADCILSMAKNAL